MRSPRSPRQSASDSSRPKSAPDLFAILFAPPLRRLFFAPGASLRRWAARLILVVLSSQAVAEGPTGNVLVLYSDNRLLPGVAVIDEAFDSRLRAELGLQVDLFNEFLDLDRLPQEMYHRGLVRFLGEKYRGTRIDALVAVRGPVLRFLLEHRDELFPGVPIVHAAITAAELAALKLPSNVIGVPIRYEPAQTLEVALRLHPKTRRLVVITGTSQLDQAWESLLRRAFQPFEERLKVDFWAGLTLADLLDRLPRLAPETLVFFPGFMQDGSGQRFVPRQLALQLIGVTPVPVYGAISLALGTGAVGGYLVPVEEVGRTAAEIAAQLLRGAAPDSIALPEVLPNLYLFDARQLRRFGVEESDLPPGAVVKYREPRIWEAYHREILGVLLLLVAQAGMIGALLVQRRNRRRAEAELRESEERMSLVAAATGLGMWLEDIPRGATWASRQQRALLGLSETEPYSRERFLEAVHPEDRAAVRRAISGALATGGEYNVRYRVPLSGGELRWVASRGRVELDPRGRPARIRGVSADVTAQEEAELATQRHRDELAYLSRVAMLGQLSGSLAHELTQPLTAILSNAQAALRFLNGEAANLVEVREILKDIVADDRRAGEVIGRLRALFERGEAHQEPLDLNTLIREVLRLLNADLVGQDISLSTDLDSRLPQVRADRVQMQQLLLNLVVNACESLSETPAGERRIEVRTALNDGGEVEVTVRDRGRGIAPGELERIFEPFVTSKALGIGLGLAIGRSIAAAHGGHLWASANPTGGATFHFSLPVRDRGSPSSGLDEDNPSAARAPAAGGPGL